MGPTAEGMLASFSGAEDLSARIFIKPTIAHDAMSIRRSVGHPLKSTHGLVTYQHVTTNHPNVASHATAI
jgi:hypothetical protein